MCLPPDIHRQSTSDAAGWGIQSRLPKQQLPADMIKRCMHHPVLGDRRLQPQRSETETARQRQPAPVLAAAQLAAVQATRRTQSRRAQDIRQAGTPSGAKRDAQKGSIMRSRRAGRLPQGGLNASEKQGCGASWGRGVSQGSRGAQRPPDPQRRRRKFMDHRETAHHRLALRWHGTCRRLCSALDTEHSVVGMHCPSSVT